MATLKAHSFFFFLLLLVPFLCNSATSSDIPLPHAEQLFPSIHRALMEYFRTQLDSIDPPTTPLSSPPITNPVTTTGSPGIVTVPGANPVNPPLTNPPMTPPATNPPVTPPFNNPPVTPPFNNPPVTPSVPVSTTPTASGGSGRWCIAKNGASQAALQAALDYACGIGGADCASIQQGSSCYEPASLQNHASFAFNSYYQKNPAPTSCDFGGAAALTTTNPSTGTCVYPTSSSSSSSSSSSPPSSTSSSSPPPTTQAPVNQTPLSTPPTLQTPVNPTSLPTPPAASSSGQTFPGTSPPGFSLGNPDTTGGLGAYGASPPIAAVSNNLQQSFILTTVALSIIIMFGL